MALAGKTKRKPDMDKVIIRTGLALMILTFFAITPGIVGAQGMQEPTQIVIGAPTQSKLGETLTVQAVLADSKGHPIAKAIIYFTTEATFLSKTNSVVLAQAITNGNGQAVAHFSNDFSGTLALRAEFPGDQQYAASNATIKISISGEGQIYVEQVGVDIPGFNVPPVGAPVASIQTQSGTARFVRSLWPAMNGWPV